MGSIYANDAVQIAKDWLGYHEGDNNWSKMAEVLDACGYYSPQSKQNVSWCATFVNFCLLEASVPDSRPNTERKWDAMNYQYQKTPNYSAGAKEHADYFKSAGKFFTDQTKAQVGDVVYFNVNGKIGHVGIVEKLEGSVLTTIEGNAGDQVQRKWYDVPGNSKIAGFGRPSYDGLVNPSTVKEEVPVKGNSSAPSSTTTNQVKPISKNLKVTTSRDPLSLRAKPNTSSMILARIPKGTVVKELDVTNGSWVNGDNTWFKVTYGGKTGWAAGYYLTRV